MPEVSYAVILTRDAERAAAAVRSVAAQDTDHELLVVLNDADDAMRGFADGIRDVRILHDGVDIGVMWGWNLAISQARSPHVCVIHEDSELQPGCAQRLLRTLTERPHAGAVAPRVLQADGVSYEGNVVWRDGATSRIPALPDGMLAIDYGTSSCLMARTDVLRGVGGFDDHFFPAIYADTAICAAIWQAGRAVLCDGRALNVHRVGAMVDAARGPRRGMRIRRFLLERNRTRFQRAHGAWLADLAERADKADARNPSHAELADALERTRRREERILAAPLAALPDRLVLPNDLEAAAAVRRRAVEDEFLAELIARETALDEEAAGVHRSYARAHAELDRVHAAYAEVHAELDRMHRAYAELWQDRARLLEPALAKDDHA